MSDTQKKKNNVLLQMIKIISLLIIPTIYCFNLISHFVIDNDVKDFKFCDTFEPAYKEDFKEVFKQINDYNIFYVEENPFSKNLICDYNGNDYLGFTSFKTDNTTDIYISNKLKNTPTTRYNVMLHEVAHSLGLNHTDYGIMKYKVRTDRYGYVMEDYDKLYLDLDDVKGLRFVKNNLRCSKPTK